MQDINIDNISNMYELSEAFNATSLRQTCILFILEQFDKLSIIPVYVLLKLHPSLYCSYNYAALGFYFSAINF